MSDSAATALATVGTVLWCVQLIPQVIRNWYVRDCEGVPPSMMFLWAASGIPFGIYFVVQTANLVLQIQPYLFMFFSTLCFWQTLYYPPSRLGFWKSTGIVMALVALAVGANIGCILPLRNLYNKGIEWPNLIPGIIAAVLLAVGLLPPYWELAKRNGRVVGINFVFLSLDSTGAIFNIAAVGEQSGEIDRLGIALYAVVVGLEFGIFMSHAIWALRVRYFGLKVEENTDEELADILAQYPPPPEITGRFRSYVAVHIAAPVSRIMRPFAELIDPRSTISVHEARSKEEHVEPVKSATP